MVRRRKTSIREALLKLIGNGSISKSDLTRKTLWASVQERDQVLADLIDDGLVVRKNAIRGARGPTGLVYSLATLAEKRSTLNDRRLGKRFGGLVVIERVSGTGNKAEWICVCDCEPSTEKRVSDVKLLAGHCGCMTLQRAIAGGLWNKQLAFYESLFIPEPHPSIGTFMDLV